MTTAAELSAQTACADLRRALASAERQVSELKACKFRLNGLIVARDVELARLYAANARLRAELEAAREGILELPY